MARRHDHEEHVNHEAWAIPYGDLITLLLAFFVVMYAVSSVNEGKYRVLSDSLLAAFRGQPHTFEPVPVGASVAKVKQDDTVAGVKPNEAVKFRRWGNDQAGDQGPGGDPAQEAALRDLALDLEIAMQTLIDQDLIRVRRAQGWVEVEIKTDILFPSGSAEVAPDALEILDRLAAVLGERPNPLRVEGHTDDRPINTFQFPSNWELSAARAARIVRRFQEQGIAPTRMVVAGMAEQAPVADNATAEGRNRNRRVTLVILGAPPESTAPDRPAMTADAVAGDPPPLTGNDSGTGIALASPDDRPPPEGGS
jgi:chemotaxis protein MotB